MANNETNRIARLRDAQEAINSFRLRHNPRAGSGAEVAVGFEISLIERGLPVLDRQRVNFGAHGLPRIMREHREAVARCAAANAAMVAAGRFPCALGEGVAAG